MKPNAICIIDHLNILKRFGHARVGSTAAEVADRAQNDLFDLLQPTEWNDIEKAREDWQIGGRGRVAFDEIINKLIQKYRHDPPNRKNMTFL